MIIQVNKTNEKPLNYTIYSEGAKLNDSFGIISIRIYRAVNRIGSCILTLEAGDMPKTEIPESDSDTFAPGKNIRVEAGYGDEEKVLFEGIVITHTLQIRENNEGILRIECREYTFPMTQGRKNRIFESATDKDAIQKIFSDYPPLQATIDNTSVTYNELVQYYATDWDFILSRADANGLVVITEGKKITLRAPDTTSQPVVKITYGANLIEFDGNLSAAEQAPTIEANGWDITNQEIITAKATTPTLNKQGDSSPDQLAKDAGNNPWILQTGVCPGKAALKTWADGQMLKTGLARIQGTVTFHGTATVSPGNLLELDGLGKRFNGYAYTGWVEHAIQKGVWITTAGMGISPENITEKTDVVAPPASGLLPGIGGLHIGKVSKLEEDPTKEQKVQVEIPVLNSENNKVWARIARFWSCSGYGAFFIPDVGDEVVLGFFNDDPCQAVILGSLYSSKRTPPYELTKENYIHGLVSKEKLTFTFDDEKKIITLETPGKNKLVLSDDAKGITLTDQNENKLILNDKGITIDSAKDLILKAKMNIKADAGAALEMKAKTDIKTEGMNVETKAKVSLKAQGTASAEFSASGQTTIKGAMVMIN